MDEALDEYYPEIVYTRTMRLRSVGPDVRCLQRVLKTMGYYGTRPDGIYNANTASAVRTFQFDYGMSVDGVVNERLVKKINSVAATLRPLREATPEQIREAAVENGNDEQVENEYHTDAVKIQWSAVDAEWKTGATMKVIDVATGVSFRVKRVGGVNHADVEPRSVDDTEKMREVFGGNWSWTRRPVVVQISYLTAAASLCGMPHGDTVIADNGIDGHFCIHFYESQTDNYRSVTDNAHQKAINEAAKYSV